MYEITIDKETGLPVMDNSFTRVVRCKDCKWCDRTDYGAGEVLECIRDRMYQVNSISLEGETYFRKVEPDDFCSWGEKREDADK